MPHFLYERFLHSHKEAGVISGCAIGMVGSLLQTIQFLYSTCKSVDGQQ